jgi:hypothetical protein
VESLNAANFAMHLKSKLKYCFMSFVQLKCD